MNLCKSMLAGLFLCWSMSVAAGLEEFDFGNGVEENRYKELISELRCLVCQNQSLADSNADLAQDLRVEIYELMDQGQSDEQIVDFLVARYGDFVLYAPPVKPSTYALWYGPFVLLAIGIGLLVRTLRQRRGQSVPHFSAEEHTRLKQLLGDEADGDKHP